MSTILLLAAWFASGALGAWVGKTWLESQNDAIDVPDDVIALTVIIGPFGLLAGLLYVGTERHSKNR
jgi:hypothetical protein